MSGADSGEPGQRSQLAKVVYIFGTKITDALKYAHEGKASVIFLVSQPNPVTANRVAWTYDYMRSRINVPIVKDIFLDGVWTYRWKNRRACHDEFVRAICVGDVFRPDTLVKLTFKVEKEDSEPDDPRT